MPWAFWLRVHIVQQTHVARSEKWFRRSGVQFGGNRFLPEMPVIWTPLLREPQQRKRDRLDPLKCPRNL